ncbi:MAG TPA: ABC transporter ATP-binding protein [Acidimicrobiales bacterium]|nr:ABC transporter ATP-binding protein [Acidimicrobiales bacterium]
MSADAAKSTDEVSMVGDDGVSISGIWKSFTNRNENTSAIEDVNLRIRRGQFVTLIGPSGCGKSTLLRIVAGLLKPDRGSVSIFGETVSHATQSKHIGFVPQTPALLPWRTVLENVQLPLQVNKRYGGGDRRPSAPRELLKSFELGDVLDRRPQDLSRGMQQRVAIARAFVFDPMILLMDEPFSALDEFTREAQRRGLLELWQSDQKTVLFVTHSVTEAVELSDVIVVMSPQPGRVQAMIPVDLPRPRDNFVENSESFHMVEVEVRRELRRTSSQLE